MCHASSVLLAFCFGVFAAMGLAQEAKTKSKADPAVVESIVNRMMAFDKNKDGKLSRDEITDPRLLRLFDRADSNKDGVVTREELVALATQLAAEQGQGGKGRRGPGDGPDGPGGFGPPPGGPGGFGPPGGPGGFGRGGPPRPGQILPPFLRDQLNLTEAQMKQLDALQKEVETRLDKILTDAQKKQLKEMPKGGRGGPRGGFGGPPPGGPGGPPPPPPDDQEQARSEERPTYLRVAIFLSDL
jgi:hypothetical protein